MESFEECSFYRWLERRRENRDRLLERASACVLYDPFEKACRECKYRPKNDEMVIR